MNPYQQQQASVSQSVNAIDPSTIDFACCGKNVIIRDPCPVSLAP